MTKNARCLAILLSATAFLAGPAEPADTCSATGAMGGKSFNMAHCAIAVYDQQGVTLWVSESPIAAEDRAQFKLSSYPKDTDAAGKKRTMMHFAFCPGGGKPVADTAAIKSVEVSTSHASSPLLWQQWVFELPRDKDLRFEKLAGELKPGGRLAGRITGKKSSDGTAYTWQVDFDLALPAEAAAAGPGCGS
jgi:hypothetical protein